MPASHELSIAKQVTEHVVEGRTQGYRIRLAVTPVRGFRDGGVFVFRDDAVTSFSNVASPVNLADLALDRPNDDGYYRTALLDIVFASRSEAEEVLGEVLAELAVLCEEQAKLINDLGDAETIVVRSTDDV